MALKGKERKERKKKEFSFQEKCSPEKLYIY
jgi:hypothetical protein